MLRLAVPLLLGLVLAAPVAAQTVRCQPNICGGQDCETPEGPVTSQPNIFGGQDYRREQGHESLRLFDVPPAPNPRSGK